jgi:uncharacterized protein
VIFIDSNIPMYIVGSDHPNRQRAQVLLEQLINSEQRLVTNAEVFQEILHRYRAQQREGMIDLAWHQLASLADEIWPIDFNIVEGAKRIIHSHKTISARDAIHIASMEQHQVSKVLSFDSDYDKHPKIRRLF